MGSAGATASHFTASRERFDTVLAFLDGAAAAALSHSDLEDRLEIEGRQLVRQLFQDHLDLRALRESRAEVVGADGVSRGRVETGHARELATVFGEVAVRRLAYRTPARPTCIRPTVC